MVNVPRIQRIPFADDLTGCFIAGGAILSTILKRPINDIDIYPKSKEAFTQILEYLIGESGFQVKFVTDKAITIRTHEKNADTNEFIVCQVMFTEDWYPTAQSIFDRFDFTVCMAAYDCDTKQIGYDPNFWPDVASRSLRVNTKTLYPLNTLIRLKKYRDKGFDISKAEVVKLGLVLAMSNPPTSWTELENQIGGSYGRVVKLATEGKEFSLEEAIDTLSSIEDTSFVETDESQKYIVFNIEQWVRVLTKEIIKYVKVDLPSTTFAGNYIVDTDGFLTDEKLSVPLEYENLIEHSGTVKGYACALDVSGIEGIVLSANMIKNSQQASKWRYSQEMFDTFDVMTHIGYATAVSNQHFEETPTTVVFNDETTRTAERRSIVVEFYSSDIQNYQTADHTLNRKHWSVSLLRKAA